MCLDDYTGRLILSNIILHIILLLASQAQIRKDKCVPEVVPYKWNLIATINEEKYFDLSKS